MSADSLRAVKLSRLSRLHFQATNSRGGTLAFGDSEAGEFSPIELLLVAIAGCTAMDVDAITVKRSEPSRFLVDCSGHYTKDTARQSAYRYRRRLRCRVSRHRGRPSRRWRVGDRNSQVS